VTLDRPGQSDFIREMQRLFEAQREAVKSGDVDAIEHAAHEMTIFLRFNAAGRLQEWIAMQDARGDQR
jgi:hypothetical protein